MAAITLHIVQSIVIAVYQPWRERVEEAWGEIKAVFNLKQLAGQTDPRIVLHVAERYDDGAADALARLASATARFTARCREPRILRGARHLVYLPLDANEELGVLHAAVWRTMAPLADAAKPAYAPETWAPHLTVAMGRLDDALVPEVQRFLALRDWRWELPLTNVCLVPDDRSGTAMWTRWELGGAPAG